MIWYAQYGFYQMMHGTCRGFRIMCTGNIDHVLASLVFALQSHPLISWLWALLWAADEVDVSAQVILSKCTRVIPRPFFVASMLLTVYLSLFDVVCCDHLLRTVVETVAPSCQYNWIYDHSTLSETTRASCFSISYPQLVCNSLLQRRLFQHRKKGFTKILLTRRWGIFICAQVGTRPKGQKSLQSICLSWLGPISDFSHV